MNDDAKPKIDGCSVDELRLLARNLGFNDLKVTGPTPQTWGHFLEWLQNRYHGEMHYLSRRAAERSDPSALLPSVRSILIVTKAYPFAIPPIPDSSPLLPGIISRYAWGEDYHEIMAEGLQKLVDSIHSSTQGRHQARWVVDTAPILEKDFAAQSGIGWIGKHTNLLNRSLGNWFFLGIVLTTLDLKPDQSTSSHCGTCTRCLDICPTKAFIRPYVMDARRCISYLTIELKGPIPREFRRSMGRHIYGCDDCLEVCPWNRFAVTPTVLDFHPRDFIQTPDLIYFMSLTDDDFRTLFRGSPIKRIKRRGFLRNVAIALGNSRDFHAVPILLQSLHDAEPLIRGHSAWALGEIGGIEASRGLQNSLENEQVEWVKEEIIQALEDIESL